MKLFNSRKSIYLLFIALYTLYWAANYLFDVRENQPPLGFCENKGRVLTQEEIIIAALEEQYKYNAIKTDDSTKTAHAFLKKYPFCCSDGPPSASFAKRNVLTGKLYITDPDYVVVSLYFPASDEVMGIPYGNNQGNKVSRDTNLNYIETRMPVSYCGGVGSGPSGFLNIKDTPFGNDSMKVSGMQAAEWRRNGFDWRIKSRGLDWQSYERYERNKHRS